MLPWEVYILFVAVAKDLDELYFLLDMAFNLVVLKDPHILFSFFGAMHIALCFVVFMQIMLQLSLFFLKKTLIVQH